MIPDTALGAIAAATIAAVIALSGFIVSKEQKTSDFRQAWIDGLRAELVEFLVQINALYDSRELKFKDIEAKIEGLREPYSKLNSAIFSVALRINPKERRSKLLIDSMEELGSLALSVDEVKVDRFKEKEEVVLKSAKNLLKYEWKRVKKGERAFRIAKAAALSAFIIGAGFALDHMSLRTHVMMERFILYVSTLTSSY